MVTVGAHSFVVINGAKKSNKQFTIELWGAEGDTQYVLGDDGGDGGYTKLVSQLGNKFNEGTTLYIEVGGMGRNYTGGYNGGANSYSGGGGATHFATKSGELSSLEGSKSSVIAVAGGGGGATVENDGGVGGGANMNGGASGGYSGGGGTLTSGGTASRGATAGSFGKGGTSNADEGGSGGGGGGGYYGGGGGGKTMGMKKYSGPGGGGSGYCNTSYGSCSGSSGVRTGNGYAKITW